MLGELDLKYPNPWDTAWNPWTDSHDLWYNVYLDVVFIILNLDLEIGLRNAPTVQWEMNICIIINIKNKACILGRQVQNYASR